MSSPDMNYSYLLETRRQLQEAGFEALRQDESLRVFLDDRPLCRITDTGAIRYRPEDIAGRDKYFDTVQDIAHITWEYMNLLEQAPPLEAESLHESYKLLSEFNGIVLAGRVTSFGTQFVTWERTHNRTSLDQGHYYGPGSGGNYTAAKRDFATRSGLVPRSALFAPEQLTEVYRSIHETLENGYPITAEREKLLEAAAEQIECSVPNLEERVNLSNQKELELGSADTPEQGGIQFH